MSDGPLGNSRKILLIFETVPAARDYHLPHMITTSRQHNDDMWTPFLLQQSPLTNDNQAGNEKNRSVDD